MVILYALWNYAGMAKQSAKPGISARLDAMLSRVKPDELTERGWLLAAKVNTSFFTDLRNKGTAPSIDKVERLARIAGLSLAEFVAGKKPDEAISASQLEQAILDSFPLPPLPFDRQAAYLADVVLDVLGLPPAEQTNLASAESHEGVERTEGALAPATTKRT